MRMSVKRYICQYACTLIVEIEKPCCLYDLACFFLPSFSHLSLKYVCLCVWSVCCVIVHYVELGSY